MGSEDKWADGAVAAGTLLHAAVTAYLSTASTPTSDCGGLTSASARRLPDLGRGPFAHELGGRSIYSTVCDERPDYVMFHIRPGRRLSMWPAELQDPKTLIALSTSHHAHASDTRRRMTPSHQRRSTSSMAEMQPRMLLTSPARGAEEKTMPSR